MCGWSKTIKKTRLLFFKFNNSKQTCVNAYTHAKPIRHTAGARIIIIALMDTSIKGEGVQEMFPDTHPMVFKGRMWGGRLGGPGKV